VDERQLPQSRDVNEDGLLKTGKGYDHEKNHFLYGVVSFFHGV